MITPHASNLGSTRTARALPISWPDAIPVLTPWARGIGGSSRADGRCSSRRRAGVWSVSAPSPESCACPRFVQCSALPESGFWQCGIALLDFEDLRTTNADPVNAVRAGYDQELLEEACLANFREILIGRGAARLQLDGLLSPL